MRTVDIAEIRAAHWHFSMILDWLFADMDDASQDGEGILPAEPASLAGKRKNGGAGLAFEDRERRMRHDRQMRNLPREEAPQDQPDRARPHAAHLPSPLSRLASQLRQERKSGARRHLSLSPGSSCIAWLQGARHSSRASLRGMNGACIGRAGRKKSRHSRPLNSLPSSIMPADHACPCEEASCLSISRACSSSDSTKSAILSTSIAAKVLSP